VRPCKCGCGEKVTDSKRYVDKAHQIAHLLAGEASRLNKQQPVEAKAKGGSVAGTLAVQSGRLADAGQKGAARAREIAQQVRQQMTA
jgi:hypothetical protein